MASGIQMTLDYGDSVELIDPTDIARFGILRGSACGFRVLDAKQASFTRFPEGTVLVLVEGESGAAVEIPSELLRKIAA